MRLRKIPRPSGAWATPSATIWFEGTPTSDFPWNSTAPFVGRTSPEMARSVVLFPAPFAPMRATIFPFGTCKEIPDSARMTP